MTRMILRTLALLSICGVAATAQADEKALKDLEKKISEAWQKHNSMTADMKISIENSAMGQTMKGTGKGKLYYMRKDGKEMMHLTNDTAMDMSFGGQSQKMTSKLLMVSDGTHTWQYAQNEMGSGMPPQKSVTKMKAEQNSFSPAGFFEQTAKSSKLEIVADEKINGMDCYTVKATPKEPNPMTPGMYTKVHFSKKDGAMVKQVTYNGEGKAIQSTEFTNIKFDEKLDPKLFTFEAPEGVQVNDMTGE